MKEIEVLYDRPVYDENDVVVALEKPTIKQIASKLNEIIKTLNLMNEDDVNTILDGQTDMGV